MNHFAARIYHGKDPGELPSYTIKEAAKYLRLPYFTLYEWIRPARVERQDALGRKPLIRRPDKSNKLSFLNLIEGHVVKALRADHQVPTAEIRAAVEYSERDLDIPRLLVSSELKAGARQLFVNQFGRLINLGRGGQLAIERMLDRYLERIDYRTHIPITLFPFVNGGDDKIIAISPEIEFGKPVILTRGIRTSVLADRYELGESKGDLAKDYGITEKEVEEAIVYEFAA